MLSCKDCLARHSEYLDGRLDVIAAEEVRDHLASCLRCARYDRVLRRGVQILASQPPIEPGIDFAFRLQQRIELEQHRAALQPMRSMAAAALAIAAMLALAAWIPVLMMATEGNERFEVTQTAEASPVSAEIAWHGAPAVDEDAPAQIHLVARNSWRPTADHHPLAPRYTPVIVGSPTEPINYSYASYSE